MIETIIRGSPPMVRGDSRSAWLSRQHFGKSRNSTAAVPARRPSWEIDRNNWSKF